MELTFNNIIEMGMMIKPSQLLLLLYIVLVTESVYTEYCIKNQETVIGAILWIALILLIYLTNTNKKKTQITQYFQAKKIKHIIKSSMITMMTWAKTYNPDSENGAV